MIAFRSGMFIAGCRGAWSASMAYALGVQLPPYLGWFNMLIWMDPTSTAYISFSVFVSTVFFALETNIPAVACAGARFSPLEAAGKFNITGFCGWGTPARSESGKSPCPRHSPFESRTVRVFELTQLVSTCLWCVSYVNFEGSLRPSQIRVTTFALKPL